MDQEGARTQCASRRTVPEEAQGSRPPVQSAPTPQRGRARWQDGRHPKKEGHHPPGVDRQQDPHSESGPPGCVGTQTMPRPKSQPTASPTRRTSTRGRSSRAPSPTMAKYAASTTLRPTRHQKMFCISEHEHGNVCTWGLIPSVF